MHHVCEIADCPNDAEVIVTRVHPNPDLRWTVPMCKAHTKSLPAEGQGEGSWVFGPLESWDGPLCVQIRADMAVAADRRAARFNGTAQTADTQASPPQGQ